MEYLKGTQTECEAYNLEVTVGENYKSTTQQWASAFEIEGCYYIPKHENYTSTLETVTELPKVEITIN